MGTKKIIIVDGCERNNTRYNGPIAAPVDIEMLVDGLNMAKEAISIKMELARELARMAGKVITKAGFNPKNFILDDEVTEEFFSANIGSNEDIEETLAFTMAGTDGFEYYAIASNHMEEDGHYASSVLFRYGKEKSQVFNIESYKWEDLPEEEIMPDEIKSILTEGGPTADFAEFILNLFDGVDADLRISFDFNIRSRRHDLALESGDVGSPLLPGTMCLMEIKTATAKPLWITHMLASLNVTRTSFSKYGTEFKHSLENNNGFYMAI